MKWIWIVACALIGVVANARDGGKPLTVLAFGDSLTAGYGLEPEHAYPAILARKAQEKGLPVRVVNGGVSGDTSSGGLRRINWLLRQHVDVLILALGANDGLRGVKTDVIYANLEAIIAKARAKYPDVQVVVAGMKLPPNLGDHYTDAFAALFPKLAQKTRAKLIPFLLDGVAGKPELNLPDGIHPTAAGQAIVAENVWRVVSPLLAEPQEVAERDQAADPTR